MGEPALDEPPSESANLAGAASLLPEGAYTTLRTFGGTGVLLLDRHLDRLEESAALIGYPADLDRTAIRRLLCQLLQQHQAHSPEARLRITLDCQERPGELWFSIEPLKLPPERAYRRGVAVLTRPMHRTNPRVKSSAFLHTSQTTRALIGGAINEVLMVGADGNILEGLSSNFFAVRSGTLFTAEEGVLPGLTRALILEEARRAAIPVQLEAVAIDGLATVEESFISSTSRSVLPVVEIDGRTVGDGRPGEITRLIATRYAARVEQEVEDLCPNEQ